MSGIDCAFLASIFKAELKTSAKGTQYLRLNCRIGDADSATWVQTLVFDHDAVNMADKFVRDARVYIEGKLSLSEWIGNDGEKRTGLNVMSYHCRLAQIGNNRLKKPRADSNKSFHIDGSQSAESEPAADKPFFDDSIPF
jgi:single-stranded DNA-binding protein